MADKNYPRPKEVPKPHGSTCLVCGLKYPLTTSHIIPKHIIYRLPKFDRRWIDYDGINIMYLCNNHHVAYDQGKLEKEEILKVYPVLHNQYLLLMKHLMGEKISREGTRRLEHFIKLHTYESE